MTPQLRVRTEYSFRNAYGPVERVAQVLSELGTPAAGIVDTAGTWGHVQWEKALKDSDVAPLFGTEFTVEVGDLRPRCWALAESLPEFYRFSSANPTDESAFADRKGVVMFAGAALTSPDTFDYVDINPRSAMQTRSALKLAKRTKKPVVLTSDNDYPAPEDAARFLAWDDSRKMTPQHLLPNFDWAKKFMSKAAFNKALKNTAEAAERCSGLTLRAAPIISVDGCIRTSVEAGRKSRLDRRHIAEWTDEYQSRLARELDLIEEKEYESYFLVVAEMIDWAKQRMLVGPARGSSAGSLVCYLMGITEVDPLVHGLIFERFIDVNRDDLPDIDIDFNDQKRELVFEHLRELYGADNVARIGSVNRLKPRSVIAHVGKKLGVPHGAAFGVTNVLIEYSSGDSRYGKGLEDTLNNTQPGREFMDRFPEAELMGELENHASHSGQHAAGMIVSNEPVTEYCTVRDGIAQIDKKDAERLNLLKIDALGLRTLGVIEDTGCVTPEELYALRHDDPEVLQIFNDRKFSGVFQFEGAAQRRVSIQVPIEEFKHIDHVTALARPGPLGGGAAGQYIERNAGREPVEYRHPSMEAYLGDTQGVVLYQEQVMRIVREIGNFSWEDTSAIRKAMSGRKGKEYFDQRGELFMEGARKSGMPEEVAAELWGDLCNFGAWCLSGDSVIQLPTANQHSPREVTLRELHANGGYGRAACNFALPGVLAARPLSKIFCEVEGEVLQPVSPLEILFSGIQETWELEVGNGQKIRATKKHQFRTPEGWVALGDLSVGDLVAIRGERRLNLNRSKPQRKNLKGTDWRTGKKRGPYTGNSIRKQFESARAARAKLVDFCEECADPWTDAHHIDEDRTNNSEENIQLLCKPCHRKKHKGSNAHILNHEHELDWSWVVRIGSPKKEETFDVIMPAPNHNFLANDFIVHNCMNKCIAADTPVKVRHPNERIPKDATIAELHKIYKLEPSAWMRQNDSMPVLLSVGEDGVARPVKALDIVCNGPMPVTRYTFSNGAEVTCTPDHKFLVNGTWRRIGDASVADSVTFFSRKRHIKNHAFSREHGKAWRKGRSGGAAERKFRDARRGEPCQDCDEVKTRLEVHHNDHQHGKQRPEDLAWLCSSCHKKRHMKAGDWKVPYARGWTAVEEVVTLVSSEQLEEIVETYDIEMPEPNHNYLLANGLVTHNSHTVSYGMISYWCAYMKAHHPLEYAAACLRQAKDDEQVIEILREFAAEGVESVAFDPDLSEMNWTAADGKLVGGFTNLVGIGPVKAQQYVDRRAATGLTEKDRESLGKRAVKFRDLRPSHTLFGAAYADPASLNVQGAIREFADLQDRENAVVICKLVKQERRDQNETVRLAKRGYAMEGQTLFLDAFVVDDSVSKPVMARLNAKQWLKTGQKMADRAVPGDDWFLIRGTWLAQFSMMSVSKIRCLTNPELFD